MLPDPEFPPLLTGHAVPASQDPLIVALERMREARLEAGDLFWSMAETHARAAIALEPDCSLGKALQMVPLLVITPLVFLGGSFYSIDMLPAFWQKVTLFNPVLYLISGFRWSFYEIADVSLATSLGMILGFLTICMLTVWWIFKTGYQVKH